MSEALENDPAVEELLEDVPRRVAVPPPRRELLAELLAAGLMLAVSGLLLAIFGLQRSPSATTVVLVLAAYVLAARTHFDIGSGYGSAAELAIVPMAFALPPALLPVAVAAGAVAHRLPEVLRGQRHPLRLVVNLPDGWSTVGPAVLLCLAGAPEPQLDQWPLLLALLAAQLVFDLGTSVLREWAVLGVPPALQMRLMGLVASVDAALAPIGLLVAMAMLSDHLAILLVLPLAALLRVFSHEREVRIQQALQLSGAYRGTALLMGDVLEADDAYTGGEHSHGVVALAVAVGEELELSSREQRDLEFAALLHDIGKLRIPNAIINKPGKLTDEEWEIVRRHPAEGQRMLERIGGRLNEVGRIVRAHHERMDGKGYPDGLAGERIPLAARIISVCDAYSAMTTHRAYRAAMPHEDAAAELRRCTPAQFDPQITAAVLRVTAAPDRELVPV